MICLQTGFPMTETDGNAAILSALAEYAGDDLAFVHFAPIPRCSLNPHYSLTTTPAGIYGYPVATVIADTERSLFASDSPYLFVFRPTNEARAAVLDVDAYGQEAFGRDYSRLEAMFGRKAEHGLYDVMQRGGPRQKPVKTLYLLTNWLAQTHEVEVDSPEASRECFAWNDILRSLGYSGIVDRGNGLVSWDIPSQCVFFSNESIDIVALMDNPLATAPPEPGR